jgi:hypothetical protein
MDCRGIVIELADRRYACISLQNNIATAAMSVCRAVDRQVARRRSTHWRLTALGKAEQLDHTGK